jgi:hypothetical protein
VLGRVRREQHVMPARTGLVRDPTLDMNIDPKTLGRLAFICPSLVGWEHATGGTCLGLVLVYPRTRRDPAASGFLMNETSIKLTIVPYLSQH